MARRSSRWFAVTLVLAGLLSLAAGLIVAHERRSTAPDAPAARAMIPADTDPAAGSVVFTNAGCGDCHTLRAAGAIGSTGPNLDDLRPTYDDVLAIVGTGRGKMPAFSDRLAAQEILDVAAFVAARAGSP